MYALYYSIFQTFWSINKAVLILFLKSLSTVIITTTNTQTTTIAVKRDKMGFAFDPHLTPEQRQKAHPRKGFTEHFPHSTRIIARDEWDNRLSFQQNIGKQLVAFLKECKTADELCVEPARKGIVDYLQTLMPQDSFFKKDDEDDHAQGLVNKSIDWLPTQLHLPYGYKWCGPGTEVTPRTVELVYAINPLDLGCKQHDIAYAMHKSDKERAKADRELAERAAERISAPDASESEKRFALSVMVIMMLK